MIAFLSIMQFESKYFELSDFYGDVLYNAA